MIDSSDSLPTELLEEFVHSGRRERAFAELVNRLGGLVYHGALRRTGDVGIAEEVTQNVFTILARKSASLLKHESLTAWIFQTTKLESAKAMRKEYTRRRKLNELAEQMSDQPLDGNEGWQDAVPLLEESLDRLSERDRKLILARFFEGRKFREIATLTGSSEAACKVRLKRILSKLSGWLSARGVTLSVVGVSSILGAEIAKAAPAAVMKTVVPKALVASKGIAATTILTNTIKTMSVTKQVTATIAVVAMMTMIPFGWQKSVANDLRKERDRLTEAESGSIKKKKTARSRMTRSKVDPYQRTVKALLASSAHGIDLDTFIEDLTEVIMERDMVGMIRIMIPLAFMEPDEVSQMLVQLKDHPGNPRTKQFALKILPVFAEEKDPGATLERTMAAGGRAHTYAKQLARWAEKDPDAALEWFQRKRDEGVLEPKGDGRSGSPESYLFAQLVASLAKSDVGRALQFFEDADESLKRRAYDDLAAVLAKSEEGQKHLAALIEKASSGHQRDDAIRAAAMTMISKRTNEEVVAYMDRFEISEKGRGRFLVNLAVRHDAWGGQSLGERADWLLSQLQTEKKGDALGDFIKLTSSGEKDGLEAWISGQPSGAVRDSAYGSRAEFFAREGNEAKGLEQAIAIETVEMREAAINKVIWHWKRNDRENWESVHQSTAREILTKMGLDPNQFIPNK